MGSTSQIVHISDTSDDPSVHARAALSDRGAQSPRSELPLCANIEILIRTAQSWSSALRPTCYFTSALSRYWSKSAKSCGIRPASSPSGIKDNPWLCIFLMFARGITSSLL